MMAQDLFSGVSDQAKAAKHRMVDARALFDSLRWRGAQYMAGYSVECQLKTKLMNMFGCNHLRELEVELQTRGLLATESTIFTHKLELLLQLTQATERLRQNADLWKAFNLVNRWIPAWRYWSDLSNSNDATDFLMAIDQVSHWIEYNI